eukprot:gb/GFBE01002227.1/.p1 GENE.gb/GFBE01002227.1/~~gb/GFBE01002227.1/.p1  ORF type:complete len:527 (+),score=107.63 gb/GFBE01002227.1/:1-1581(+)
MYCVPHFISENILGEDSLTMQLLGTDGPLGNFWFRMAAAFGGLHRCWLVLLAAIPFAMIQSYTYLFLLKCTAYAAVMISIITTILAIISVGVYFWLVEVLSGDALVWYHAHNALFKMFDAEYAAYVSKGLGVLFLLVGALLACGLAAMRKSLQVAIGCVVAACECIFSMPAMLFQPCAEACAKIALFGLMMAGLTMLLSTADMEPQMTEVHGEIVGGLTRKFIFSHEQRLMVVFYAFGMLWLVELLNSLSQFIISYAVILWYYHPKPKGFGPSVPLIRGLIVGIFFHLGTVAFGAFLICTLRVVRIVFTWIARQAKAEGNQCCAVMAGCCACCVSCVQRYMEFITKNAYIDVALSSTSFLTAAQNAYGFIAADTSKVAILTGACFIVSVGVVAGVFTLTAGLTWLMVTTHERWTDSNSAHYVENPYFVAGMSGVIGSSVAVCFMVIFDHCADTLLYVFLWNKSHGHNTVAKYAPDSLIALTEYRKVESTGGGRVPRPEASGIFSSFFSSKAAAKADSPEQQGLLGR